MDNDTTRPHSRASARPNAGAPRLDDVLWRLVSERWLDDGGCGCNPCVLSRCLRLLLAPAEECGMSTSRADAIHGEVMSAVTALAMRGRDMHMECAVALDAVQDALNDDDDDDEDDDDNDEDDDENPSGTVLNPHESLA